MQTTTEDRSSKSLNLFFDIEFTSFNKGELISIAIVSEGGDEFYAENKDFSVASCSDFVHSTVIPLLQGSQDTQNSQITKSFADITTDLQIWMSNLLESYVELNFICDYPEDQAHLEKLLQDYPKRTQVSIVIMSDLDAGIEIFFEYSKEAKPHHALWDARALHNGYKLWKAGQNRG